MNVCSQFENGEKKIGVILRVCSWRREFVDREEL